MQRMGANLALVVIAYIIPLYVFNKNQNNYVGVQAIQWGVFVVLFLGAALLTYLNIKNIKTLDRLKWFWGLFIIIGVLGLIYAGFALYLLYSFSNGIGL